MSQSQRYISKELTHFIGRGLSEKEQYELLVRIITTGKLLHPPFSTAESGNLTVNPNESISENRMYNPQVVCFCDIPLDDLQLHMSKYSSFGLSFLKQYLVKKGANPVFYVANDSVVWDQSESHNPRGKYYDEMIKMYGNLFKSIRKQYSEELHVSGNISEFSRKFDQLRDLRFFLDFEIFSFLKCFDSSKSDEDTDNYYMEREWRVLGHVFFNLEDVQRVILPRAYVARFRQDVPLYAGQVLCPNQL
jgi:hypothetical protein